MFFFKNLFLHFRLPDLIRLVKLPGHKANIMNYLKELSYAAPVSHQSLAYVEKVFHILQSFLKMYVQDDASNWDVWLPYVTCAINQGTNFRRSSRTSNNYLVLLQDTCYTCFWMKE